MLFVYIFDVGQILLAFAIPIFLTFGSLYVLLLLRFNVILYEQAALARINRRQ